jgi:Ser/Thr protein kinase RdoA (MazF antagonist)
MPELESKRAQVARIRRTAVRALADFPVDEPRLTFIAHGENTTFRVDSRDGRYLIRVHRPNRHGPGVDSRLAVGSELDWLAALQAGTELNVPTPIRTRGGQWTTVADDLVCLLGSAAGAGPCAVRRDRAPDADCHGGSRIGAGHLRPDPCRPAPGERTVRP